MEQERRRHLSGDSCDVTIPLLHDGQQWSVQSSPVKLSESDQTECSLSLDIPEVHSSQCVVLDFREAEESTPRRKSILKKKRYGDPLGAGQNGQYHALSGEGAVCAHTPSAENIMFAGNAANVCNNDAFLYPDKPRGMHRSPSQENIWDLLARVAHDHDDFEIKDMLEMTDYPAKSCDSNDDADEEEPGCTLEREYSDVVLARSDKFLKVKIASDIVRTRNDDSCTSDDSVDHRKVQFFIGDKPITGGMGGDESSEENPDDLDDVFKPGTVTEQEYPRYSAKTGRVGSISCPQGPGIIVNQSTVPICRICLCPGDDREGLITPCRCSGTMMHVHYTCLMKWLQISARRSKKPPVCELCSYPYQRHKKFRTDHWQFPTVSKKDKILHGVFLLCLLIMMGCATSFILCFKKDGGQRSSDQLELTKEEVLTLACGVLFFGAFFAAMYVEVKAKNTIYKVIVKFFEINHTWIVMEYDKNKDGTKSIAQPV